MSGKIITGLLLCFCSLTSRADCVVLLHGLARTSSSMAPLSQALTKAGYRVVNVDYPSREKPIEELAPLAIGSGLEGCRPDSRIHFVTHSLGGILVRYYLANNDVAKLGRVVMIAPPNQGSEVVDNLGNIPGFTEFNGPAGAQLGTGINSVPLSLGPVDYEVGIIAGTESVNIILSQYLPNPDDGKVSVASTRVEGMQDFIKVPYSHPFIMRAPLVIKQTQAFLTRGKFDHGVAE
jgi:pimeloyl-ACP methyl ester carboxylesterase